MLKQETLEQKLLKILNKDGACSLIDLKLKLSIKPKGHQKLLTLIHSLRRKGKLKYSGAHNYYYVPGKEVVDKV